MTLLIQLNRQLHYLFIAVLLACFAIAQTARAVTPGSDGGDASGNAAEEEQAVLNLCIDTENAAMGQQANENNPNKRVIPINIRKPLQCAGGDVILHGDLVVTFEHVPGEGVLHKSVKLEGFRGNAVAGGRTLVADKTKFIHTGRDVKLENGLGVGKFGGIEFEVAGPGLPGGAPLRFMVKLGPILYEFRDGKVTKIVPDDTPIVKCKR
jgi:hypothetical protein